MYKKDCFAYSVSSVGYVKCKALNNIDCYQCKFYRTQEDYNKNVLPLKHENDRNEVRKNEV